MPDPRRFDLVVRSVTTAAISLVITLAAVYQAIRTGDVTGTLAQWGGIIIGVYIGSHASLNGSGVRAARDQALTKELLEATPPPSVGTTTTTTVERNDD